MRLIKYIWNFICGNECNSCKYCHPNGYKCYCRKYKDREIQTYGCDTCADFKEAERIEK